MTTRRRDVARRVFGAALVAIALGVAAVGPVGAARSSGPSISGVTWVGDCQLQMTYNASGGKLGEVDLYAQTWGFQGPNDPVAGYDIWAGSTWQPATMSRGSATVVFQLASGGRLKQLTYYGWLYGKAIGTYKPGTQTPYYPMTSTCVIPDYLYTVKFHDGYTQGDAGFIPANQQRLTFGSLIAEPTPPVRTGYVFLGWWAHDYGYLAANPDRAWNFASDRMRDYDPLVMYAHWAEACNPDLGCADPG